MSHKQAKAERKASRLAGHPKPAGVTPRFHIADAARQSAIAADTYAAGSSANPLGITFNTAAMNNRIRNLSGRSKYMPHQGRQECARRCTALLF